VRGRTVKGGIQIHLVNFVTATCAMELDVLLDKDSPRWRIPPDRLSGEL
jgi:hypothetical protein